MDVMFLFKAPRGLLRHYSFCALWKGASAGANLPIFSHGLFTVFPLNPVHVLSLHLHAAMEGAVWMWRQSCLLCVKSKYVFCPISTHFTCRNAILLFPILFHFPPDPAKNWFGIFLSFVSFFRHSNFSLSQDLYYWSCVFASLWQMFLFLFQLDWLGLAGQFENWQAPKCLLLSVWHSQRQDSAAMFLKGDIY